MRNFFLTNFENQSSENFNIIWNSYRENKNSLSLIKLIDQNSKLYKKKIIKELQIMYDGIYQNKKIKKKLIIGKNFNFLDTFLISEKSFYKDKYNNLSDLIKCLALIDQIQFKNINQIIFNINNENVYDFLKSYCESNNIRFIIKKKLLFDLYFSKIKFFFKIIYNFFSFFKFLSMRINIPKSKKSLFNKKNIFFDYFCYFDKKKFINGNYISNYWGDLPKKMRSKKDSVFCHIYMENNHLKKNEIYKSINNLNSMNKEKHFIIDSILNLRIILNIYKKWFYFLLNFFSIKNSIYISLKLKNNTSYFLLKKSITDNLIGFNSLLNLYYYYLFDHLFKNDFHNLDKNNFYYLCENQGWEKSLLSNIKSKNKKIKIYSIVSTPIRFWDLRYSFLKHELINVRKKITKICVMSFLSKEILKKNKVSENKIFVVESLRYESLIKKRENLRNKEKNNCILIIGDYLKIINRNIENFTLDLLSQNKNINIIAKPHPSNKFSKKFENNPRIKISNENLIKLSMKTNFCICSNMTSAAYDLLYLNFKLFILLANDSINFSPLKDFKDVEFINEFNDIDINKKNRNIKNLDFRKNAFLFNQGYKKWNKIL